MNREKFKNGSEENNSTLNTMVATKIRTKFDNNISKSHPLNKLTKSELIAALMERQHHPVSCHNYPNGLIGQKVVFVPRKEDKRSKIKYHPLDYHPMPERGYFTIKSAKLDKTCGGGVTVGLDGGIGYPSLQMDSFSVKWIAPYVEHVKI